MDEDEDDADWDTSSGSSAPASTGGGCSDGSRRVVLHFDLDCFYAQVEMVRNPALRDVPLGVQQKYIVVTCNYVAREYGVTKLMSVTAAKEKCPQLVLVKGEDLTHYRETSYKVTELLMSYCPLVERLGFDENFMDITEIVNGKIREAPVTDYCFSGHVYNCQAAGVRASEYPRLAVGSQIAAELRGALHSRLGLTSCAGIASSKLLAKLVSGAHKPNQQTTLLPKYTGDIIGSLTGLRQIPGIGYRTGEKLKALGLLAVRDLQVFHLAALAKEFGEANAQRIQNLAHGIDESPVTPSGPPQSLSDEDSFKEISTVTETVKKLEDLLTSLLERMHKDGRQPSTFRLTIRRFSSTDRWFSRESRQCPIPIHIGQKVISGSSEALPQLVSIGIKLFHKLIDTSAPFHLTLMNVCFSNLLSRRDTKGSIKSFFTAKSPSRQDKKESLSLRASEPCVTLPEEHMNCRTERTTDNRDFESTASTSLMQLKPTTFHKGRGKNWILRLPADVDPDVFSLLPEHIQKEIIPTFHTAVFQHIPPVESRPGAMCSLHDHPLSTRDTEGLNVPRPSSLGVNAACPPNVDPRVFSELPPDLQQELLSEWKQQKPVLKIPSKKVVKGGSTKEKKTTGQPSQANNLLKYFKPN
ncbi:DNA polymerase iota isoform X1 [Denticeps clupeoides]|uniref:DNA polymerase iota isoform X1 n=1 Tax=Denticeps clupeoides TaxID=299321 RepID=UPI0010A5505A|nr:DNA polymerase iota isoform X1 [Denticeps clupeoides]